MSIAGLLIRRERLARAWSQAGLCRGICGTSYLSKIEQGKAAASEEILTLLLARLGLSWTNDEDGALRARTEACMEALFSGDASAFARLRAQESTLLCSPCAADYLLLRAFSCKKDGERHPLDTEFIPFLDQRQLALQRVLEGRHEEAALLYPAAVIRLWQGAHLYARGRYAAATEALRAAYDAAAAEGYAHIMMSCRVYLGNCCSDSGDAERMRQHYAVAQRLALALGDQDILSTIRYNEAATKIECGGVCLLCRAGRTGRDVTAQARRLLRGVGAAGRGARRACAGGGDAPRGRSARTRAADARACALSSGNAGLSAR